MVPLGTEVNVGPGDVVLHGVAVPPIKGAQSPVFGLCLLWPNGWMDETPLGTEVDLGPGHIVLDGVPAHRKRGTAHPSFRSMSIVAVATIAHLSYC